MGKWTLETCIEEALKYPSYTEWQRNSKSSYEVARVKGWLKDIQKVLPVTNKAWTLESCVEEAKKFSCFSDWMQLSPASFSCAQRKNWMKECTKHMKRKQYVRTKGIKWTLETCKQEALKYLTRLEWQKKSGPSYQAAIRHKWIDECTKHMLAKRTLATTESVSLSSVGS